MLLAAMVISAKATIRTITCQNSPSHFLPVTVNAVVGDTIHWSWLAGNHVVGPINALNIPGGAAMFNAPISSSNTSFAYVVTVAGNYHYVCHPSSPHGEDGYMVVSGATGLKPSASPENLFLVYPNPSNGKFQLAIDGSQIDKNCKMQIYSLHGKLIDEQIIYKIKTEVDLSNQPEGIYFIEFYVDKAILTKKIVIQ